MEVETSSKTAVTSSAPGKLTLAKQDEFCRSLVETGANVSASAKLIGVSRQALYQMREKDESFAALWDEAIEAFCEIAEQELNRRAVQGYEEPVFWKGEIVGTVKKHSDNLLMFQLKALKPEKYRDHATGAGPTVNIQINTGIKGTPGCKVKS